MPCISSIGWRVVTREVTSGRDVMTWIAVTPIGADGPTDPRIPTARVFAGGVRGLGYCLPQEMLEQVHAARGWRLAGGDTTWEATELELHPLTRPVRGWADLFAAPSAGPHWMPGRYVLAVTVEGDEPAWLGVDIIEAGSQSPSETTSPRPSG